MTEEPSPREATALSAIARTDDATKLRGFMQNAIRVDSSVVKDAAFRRLVEVLPSSESGPVALDFWRSVHALEEALTLERKRTTRLARTRLKIAKVGVQKTLEDLATAKTPSEGFDLLMERGMTDLTAEAVVLRHSQDFSEDVVAAATSRLVGAGIDPSTLETQNHG